MKKIEETESRKVPFKNYIILLVIGILTVLITQYINEWIKSYHKYKISISPLSGEVSEININELDMTLNETGEVVLYVSYTNDNDIHKKEKKLLNLLKRNNQLDYIIYLNVNDYLDNEEYLTILKNRFDNTAEEIKKAPLFIYLNNGEAIKVFNSIGRVVDDSDFSEIIETYEIEK